MFLEYKQQSIKRRTCAYPNSDWPSRNPLFGMLKESRVANMVKSSAN